MLRGRYTRWYVIVGCGAAALLIMSTAFLLAVRHVPVFYKDALAVDAAHSRAGSDEFLSILTALANASKRAGPWCAVITEEQVNGWLAIDLQENHVGRLPTSLAQPRVQILPGHAVVACQCNLPGITPVVSVQLEVRLSQSHEVALRIHAARAGRIPVPMTALVDAVGQAAERLNMRMVWRQIDGDPVALISLPPAPGETLVHHLDAFQLREHELYLAGHSEQRDGAPSSESNEQPSNVAQRLDENRAVQ